LTPKVGIKETKTIAAATNGIRRDKRPNIGWWGRHLITPGHCSLSGSMCIAATHPPRDFGSVKDNWRKCCWDSADDSPLFKLCELLAVDCATRRDALARYLEALPWRFVFLKGDKLGVPQRIATCAN
jgi:hypothetical protein